MNKQITILGIIMLSLISCSKNEGITKVDIGHGVEIYLTATPMSCNLQLDYSTVDLDTILLSAVPMLRYNDLLKYDTITHQITLGITHDSLHIGNAGVYGRMFVVTVDKEPIYCGFNWSVYSSVGCNWVFIEEPFEELDHLPDNEIRISINSGAHNDPRLDRRIVDRLIDDGRIKN